MKSILPFLVVAASFACVGVAAVSVDEVEPAACRAPMPMTIEPTDTVGLTTQCPNDDTRWYTREPGYVKDTSKPTCLREAMLPETPPRYCTVDLEALRRGPPEDLAEPPPVDPEFDEHSPEGPGPGPPGAPPVDKPDTTP